MFAKPRHAPDAPFRAGAFPGRNRRSRRTAGFCVSMQERSPPRRNARTLRSAQRSRTHAPRILAFPRILPRHFSFSSAALACRTLCAYHAQCAALSDACPAHPLAFSRTLAHPSASLQLLQRRLGPSDALRVRSAQLSRTHVSRTLMHSRALSCIPAHPRIPPRHFSFPSAALACRTLCAYHAQRAALLDACPAHSHAFSRTLAHPAASLQLLQRRLGPSGALRVRVRSAQSSRTHAPRTLMHSRAPLRIPPRHFSFSSAAFARRRLCASASAS